MTDKPKRYKLPDNLTDKPFLRFQEEMKALKNDFDSSNSAMKEFAASFDKNMRNKKENNNEPNAD